MSGSSKTVILIMGKSGCGKSTLERNLIKQFPNSFKKVVSSTTRPNRPGEQDGVDYWFIPDSEYDNTDFIQTTEFAGHRYGSAVSEYQTSHSFPILCVVPLSAKAFTETLAERFPDWETYNVWFDVSDVRLRANMRKRGDTDEMITKRLAQDTLKEQFIESGLQPDFTVKDDDLNEKLHERVALDVMLRRLAAVSYSLFDIDC
jgi:guanylate kinase